MHEFYIPEDVKVARIRCSDRRMPDTDGKTINIRTAGASVANVSSTIADLVRRYGVGVEVSTHTDTQDVTKGCGWLGRLVAEQEALLNGTRIDAQYISTDLIEQFTRRGLTSRAGVERGNQEVQEAALKRVLVECHGKMVPGKVIDTSIMPTNDDMGHALIVTTPNTARNADVAAVLNAHGGNPIGPYNAYYSQVYNVEEALLDVRLFVGALHIRDVRVFSMNPDEDARMRDWEDRIRSEPVMKGVNLTLVTAKDSNGNRRRQRV